jgi:aspartyl-tRNA(Asn)/glutamyl-tRNA(Gln) amidotransferase subunit A
VHIPEQLEGVDGWKVALSIHLGDFPVDPEVAANTHAAADALRVAGAVVEEVELAWKREDILRAARTHYGAIFAPSVRMEAGDMFDSLMPYTRAFVHETEVAFHDTGFLGGLVIEGQVYAELGALFERYDALICPTVSVTALTAGDDYTETGITVDGVELEGYFETLLTVPFNIANRCPVLAVPSGVASNGVPTGVQIVGPTYSDEVVFRVGAVLEQLMPWFDDPSWRPSI